MPFSRSRSSCDLDKQILDFHLICANYNVFGYTLDLLNILFSVPQDLIACYLIEVELAGGFSLDIH